MPLWCQQSAMSSALSKLPLDNLRAGGGRPPTNRGPAAKPFIFYFALTSDACETTTLLSCLVDRCYSQAQLLFHQLHPALASLDAPVLFERRLVHAPGYNAPLIPFLMSALYMLFACFIRCLPTYPFFFTFSLLIFSFKSRPHPVCRPDVVEGD